VFSKGKPPPEFGNRRTAPISLFRQPRLGDWGAVFSLMAEELGRVV
jgi:hypothetical protein